MDSRLTLAISGALCLVGCDNGTATPPTGAAPLPPAAVTSGGPTWLVGTENARAAAIERHLRGFDLAMVETSYRYAELHAAGEDRNWGYALYQAGKVRLAIANGVERRPKRAASARMIEGPLDAVEAAAKAGNVAAFDAAFDQLTTACNACHQAEQVGFIHVGPPPVRTSVLVRAPTNACTVFVVRHAQALKNVPHPPDMTDEQLDVLTPVGRAQAAALARHLSSRRVEVVVASPTARARGTAEAIANAAGVAVIETAALASLRNVVASGPSMQGATTSESESFEGGVSRAMAAVSALAHPGGAIVLVTHGDIAAGLIGQALGTPVERRIAEHDPPEGSVTELEVDAAGWRLIRSARSP